jgi:hypothetical protein
MCETLYTSKISGVRKVFIERAEEDNGGEMSTNQ